MKRIGDQVMVLEAIEEVRKQLKVAEVKDRFEVLGRLVALYSLLRVDDIKKTLEASDTRKNKREAA